MLKIANGKKQLAVQFILATANMKNVHINGFVQVLKIRIVLNLATQNAINAVTNIPILQAHKKQLHSQQNLPKYQVIK